MQRIDYDGPIHARYAQGADLPKVTEATWMAAFARWLPPTRPLRIADVGSGTGRFSPALAATFGGPVVGVEPSRQMRDIALASAAHDDVVYLGGRCEAIPLATDAVDAALLFGVWHHVIDPVAAAGELQRVVHPSGRVLMRTSSADRLARPWWDTYFPEVRQADLALLPHLAETLSIIGEAGLSLLAVDEVMVPCGLSRRADFTRLQARALSTFEHLGDATIEAGFTRIADGLAHDPRADRPPPPLRSDLLVFTTTECESSGSTKG